MNDQDPYSWIPAAVFFIIGWLITWGSWISGKVLTSVSREEFEKHRLARDAQFTVLVAEVAKRDDIAALRAEVADLRNLLIRDLREKHVRPE